MRNGKLALALLAALVLAPASAQAQYAAQEALGDPDVCITGYYNLNFGGDVYKGLSATTWHASRSHGLGASVTLLARHLVSAEVDFNYSHSFFGTSDSLNKNYVLTTTLDGVVGPWFSLGSGRIRTYAVAGGGYMRGMITNRRRAGWSHPSKNLGVSWGRGAAEKDNGGYGKFDNFTYLKSTLGFTVAF